MSSEEGSSEKPTGRDQLLALSIKKDVADQIRPLDDREISQQLVGLVSIFSIEAGTLLEENEPGDEGHSYFKVVREPHGTINIYGSKMRVPHMPSAFTAGDEMGDTQRRGYLIQIQDERRVRIIMPSNKTSFDSKNTDVDEAVDPADAEEFTMAIYQVAKGDSQKNIKVVESYKLIEKTIQKLQAKVLQDKYGIPSFVSRGNNTDYVETFKKACEETSYALEGYKFKVKKGTQLSDKEKKRFTIKQGRFNDELIYNPHR